MAEFDPRVPSIARVYDYLLGGKDNFAADRELGEELLAIAPGIGQTARGNKRFLANAVAWVARQGIAQFVDLGAGLPTSPSTQETARDIVPEARVVYVDNDPVVIAHLRVMLASGEPGVSVVDGDVREADAVLRAVAAGVDLSAPVCLVLGAVLHFFPPQAGKDLVSRYTAALAPGSYLVLSVGMNNATGGTVDSVNPFISAYREAGNSLYNYTRAQAESLFEGLTPVGPGIVDTRSWRADWACLPGSAHRPGGIVGAVALIS